MCLTKFQESTVAYKTSLGRQKRVIIFIAPIIDILGGNTLGPISLDHRGLCQIYHSEILEHRIYDEETEIKVGKESDRE